MADQQSKTPDVLPKQEPKFNGIIRPLYKDSKLDKIPVTKAPEGAPNVLIVLIDDCGFGQWGAFGGQVPTPNLDRVGKTGLALRPVPHHGAVFPLACRPAHWSKPSLCRNRDNHGDRRCVSNIPGKSLSPPRWCPRSCGRMVTAPLFLARITTSRIGRRTCPGHLTAGHVSRDSITSTVSLAVNPISGSHLYMRTIAPLKWRFQKGVKITTHSTRRQIDSSTSGNPGMGLSHDRPEACRRAFDGDVRRLHGSD
jgi:hypothetical protein